MSAPRALVAPAVPFVWRAARRVWPVVVGLVGVRLGVEVVGQLVMAAVLAPVVLVWGLGRWAAMERRLDEKRRRPAPDRVVFGPRGPGPVDVAGEHLAFAQALAAVAARYLAACEEQAKQNAASGRGWR